MTTRTYKSGKRTVYTILLSVCLFLGVICACLLVALVLIGRHLAAQSLMTKNCTKIDNRTENYFNDAENFESDTSNEISVKLWDRTKYISSTPQPDWRSGWRLPRDVQPLHYDLTLAPNLTSGDFGGKVNITIRSTEPRDHFVLHGDLINIMEVEMYSAETNEQIDVINFHNDSVHQLWVVDLEDTLSPGVYYLIFTYSGVLIDRRVGFYASSYLDQNDTRRYIATSKLEPTYARQAFPCFDEPNFKAKYTVHLQIPKGGGYIALSNMNQDGDPKPIPDDYDNVMVHFNESVPMSTYLACFIVCDFIYKNDTVVPRVGQEFELRVYSSLSQIDKTDFALIIGKKVTEYYIKYFKIAYPLPKLDMIAIPDFVSGAMEHWGLVTFRETALLYDSAKGDTSNKQRVAIVVAHELAHMWFGNLVTMNWWNDLWLNEGFATYMEFKSLNRIMPGWGMADQFLIDQLHPVLDFDSTLATHPIVMKVTTPNEITEIFDPISYNKGASVLRMLESTIGEKQFKAGIRSYISKNQYSNAVTSDLWKEIENSQSRQDIQNFMDTWTLQAGYPVITMTEDENGFTLKQKRFLANPENSKIMPILGYKWDIPITYFSDDNPEVNVTWFRRNDVIKKFDVTFTKWVKLNSNSVGYYRVNYTPDMWLSLTENIQNFSVADRTNLLEDSFSLAKAGETRYRVPLDMTIYLENEEDYVPWVVAIKKFDELKVLLKNNHSIHEEYTNYVLKVLSPIYDKLQWPVIVVEEVLVWEDGEEGDEGEGIEIERRVEFSGAEDGVEEPEAPPPVVEEEKEPEAPIVVEEEKEPEAPIVVEKEEEPEPPAEEKEPEEPPAEETEKEPEEAPAEEKEAEEAPAEEKEKEPEEPSAEKKEKEPEELTAEEKEKEPETETEDYSETETEEVTDEFPEAEIESITEESIESEIESEIDDPHLDDLLREKIINAACRYGHEECKNIAREKFLNWLNKDEEIHVDVKGLVYKYGMEKASKTEWEQIFEKYVNEIDASEKLKLLKGLASVKDSNLLQILLDRAEDESIVRGQDYFTCLRYISNNEIGTDMVWHYVRENWAKLVKRFTLNDRYLGRLIPAITSSFATKTKLSEMEYFFNTHPEAGAGEISRKQALENVKTNIKWISKYEKQVAVWLKYQSKK